MPLYRPLYGTFTYLHKLDPEVLPLIWAPSTPQRFLGPEAWWDDPATACPTKPICLRHQRMFNELNVALSCPMSTWEAGG